MNELPKPKNDAEKSANVPGPQRSGSGLSAVPCSPPMRKRGESMDVYQNRLDDWKLDQACRKTGMRGVGQNRNARWRLAELERKLSMDEEEIW